MNLLPHPHPHVCFQLRNRDNSPCVSRNERGRGRALLLLRMRCSSSSKKSESESKRSEARDRIITFGKYKGKMLGSLPSGYLKWVSSNLRAGDTEEWAKLADKVLQDPIYRDRIEWEMALNVLNGDNLRSTSTSTSPVSLLLDISDRFGWDYHDKLAWSKVDFDLLGTSKGSRIPRSLTHAPLQHQHDPKPNPHPPTSITLARRMQRRERQKIMRLRLKTQPAPPLQPQQNNNQNSDDGDMMRPNQNQNAIANPFPGRQALLTNFQNHKI